MENVICPNCGFQFPLDKSRDFCFCLKCGTKIEVPKYEEIQPEVQKVKPKAQDLLIDLSTEFETDWRIWWEVSKPIDYK